MYFKRRLAAFLIDYIMFMPFYFIIMIFTSGDMFFESGVYLTAKMEMLQNLFLLFIFVFFMSRDIIKGQSIGKRIARIKVVDNSQKKCYLVAINSKKHKCNYMALGSDFIIDG